jgi:hypothetical protein
MFIADMAGIARAFFGLPFVRRLQQNGDHEIRVSPPVSLSALRIRRKRWALCYAKILPFFPLRLFALQQDAHIEGRYHLYTGKLKPVKCCPHPQYSRATLA